MSRQATPSARHQNAPAHRPNRILLPLLLLTPALAVVASRALVPWAVIVAALTLTQAIFEKRHHATLWPPALWPPVLWTLLVVILLGALSALWNDHPELSLISTAKLIGHSVLAGLLVLLPNRLPPATVNSQPARHHGERRALWTSLVVIIAVLGLQAVSSTFALDSSIAGLLPVTNPGTTVVVVFTPVLALVAAQRHGNAAALTIVAIIAVIVLGFSLSLAAQIALLVALVSGALVLWWGRRAVRLLALATVALIMLQPASRLVDPTPFGTVRQMLAENHLSLPSSAVHRTHIYDFVLDRIAERPLLGWGLGSSRAIPGGQDPITESYPWEKLPLHPHNGPLQAWLELGVFGVAALAGLLWSLFAACIRLDQGSPSSRPLMAALTACLCSYLTVGLFAFSLLSSWWIEAGVLAAATCVALVRKISATGA